jgi:hypothetical protein
MIRVLVALSPQMYRQVVALGIHSGRPGLDVRLADPEDAEGEIASFRPHLLVYNDTAPIAEGALEGVPCRMEVLYSDSMNARLLADGRFEELGDAELGDLLGAVDRAAALAEREGDPGLG